MKRHRSAPFGHDRRKAAAARTTRPAIHQLSVYLLHALVLWAVWDAFAPIGRHVGGDLAFLADALLVLAITTPLAWLLYRLVELPGIAWGRLLFDRLIAHRAARPRETSVSA